VRVCWGEGDTHAGAVRIQTLTARERGTHRCSENRDTHTERYVHTCSRNRDVRTE